MNENNLSQAQLYALLLQASKKMHTTPEQLAKTFQQGGLDGVVDALPPEAKRQAAPLLADRARMEALMNSPQVQRLLEQLLNKDR